MANMLKAIYEPTKRSCWVNMDYVIDVFDAANKVRVYTFDNEREGYLIDRTDFEQWVRELPPDRPKGRWIPNNGYLWCSECGLRNSKRTNFCENCGTEMEQ